MYLKSKPNVASLSLSHALKVKSNILDKIAFNGIQGRGVASIYTHMSCVQLKSGNPYSMEALIFFGHYKIGLTFFNFELISV